MVRGERKTFFLGRCVEKESASSLAQISVMHINPKPKCVRRNSEHCLLVFSLPALEQQISQMELSKAKLMSVPYSEKHLLSLDNKYNKQPFRASE